MIGRVEAIHEMEMTAAEEAETAALLVLCFDTDFGGRSFFRTRHHLRLVIRDEGRLAAHMALQFRSMRLGGRLVDVACLAEVATHPDHRGQGLAGQLLQEAIGAARRARAAHFLLFGTARLYEAAGFVQARNPIIYVEMDGAFTGEIKRARANILQVLDLSAETWDQASELDLLGALF